MQNPFDQFDNAPSSGPVYGPPPAAPRQRDPAQVRLDDLRAQEIEQRLAKPDEPKTIATDVTLQQKRASLQSLETQINRVQQLYDSNLKGEALGVLSSLGDFLPTEENKQFDAASAGLAEQGMSAFRVPGVGAQSDTELRQFVEANRPYASNYDATIEEKLRQLRVRVDATRSEMGLPPAQWSGMEAPPAEAAPASPDNGGGLDQSRNLNEIAAPSGSALAPSASGTQTVANPALAGVRGEYLSRLEAGQGPGELIQFLRSAGIQDPKILRSAVEQANFRRQNPNVPITNYNTDALDLMDVPLTQHESAWNDAAQTPLGAGAANFANNLTAGVPAYLAGDEGQAALQVMQAENPVASTVGAVGGAVGGALGGEALLAGRMAPGVGRSLLADTGYGAALGATSAEEGERLSGAVTGAGTALAGSAAGNMLMRGAGSAISPTGGRLSGLYAEGVRPTVGQRMISAGDGKGLSGLVGRAVNATEEGLSSVPIVGSAIRGARQEARDQFQLGAYNQALREIGKELPKGTKTGTAPYAFTKKAFDDAYDDARTGLSVAPDAQLASDVGALGLSIQNLAESSIKRFEQIVQNVVMRRAGATIDGASFKKIQSEIGKISRSIRKSASGDGELADALDDFQAILDSAARRSSAPDAVAKLDAADAGYARFVRIRDAAKARGGEAGEFTPTQFDRSVQRNTPGRFSDAYLRGQALMQDYAQQGMSLVDRMPNSGTADRLWTGGAAAGLAGYAEPSSLGVLGLIGALYAPGVRKATAGTMAPRGGPKTKAVADAIRKRARIAGAVGAGAALSAGKDDDQ